MNLATVVEVDGAPMLIIYPKKQGTHHHDDIEGFTCLETGRCTTVRFETERMPEPGTDTNMWLNDKAQEVLGMRIRSRSWNEKRIDIMQVYPDHPVNQSVSVAV